MGNLLGPSYDRTLDAMLRDDSPIPSDRFEPPIDKKLWRAVIQLSHIHKSYTIGKGDASHTVRPLRCHPPLTGACPPGRDVSSHGHPETAAHQYPKSPPAPRAAPCASPCASPLRR